MMRSPIFWFAAGVGAGEVAVLTQGVDQGAARLDQQGVALSVDGEPLDAVVHLHREHPRMHG